VFGLNLRMSCLMEYDCSTRRWRLEYGIGEHVAGSLRSG